MAITVAYAPGRTAAIGDQTEKRDPIIVTGTLDRLQAQAVAYAFLPRTISNGNLGYLYIHDVLLNERRTGLGIWDGEGVYKPSRMFDPGCQTWEYDTTAENTRITQSLSTVGQWNINKNKPFVFNGSIGMTMDGPQGADVLWPKLDFNENWRLPYTTADFALYAATLATATGSVNLNAFRGFPPKSVLFVGVTARWSQVSPLWVDLAFKFRVGQQLVLANVNNLQDANGNTQITKGYWEYLWFFYEQDLDNSAGTVYPHPLAARTEQVYPTTDFALLGIGTAPPASLNALPAPVAMV